MKLDISPMLNAYPDSMGGTLHDIVQLLARPEFENVFGSFYHLAQRVQHRSGPWFFSY